MRTQPKKLPLFYIILCLSILVGISSSCYYSPRAAKKLYEKAVIQKPFDIVVVPGVPFANGQWDFVMRGRILWAKHLYDNGIAKNIMFSGSAVYSPYVEAEIMKLYAVALGIPAANIFTETKAEHSTENIYYSFHKSKNLGFQKIALASDPFQSKMLRKFVRKKVSPEIAIIPFLSEVLAPMDTFKSHPKIDEKSAFRSGFVSIINRESF